MRYQTYAGVVGAFLCIACFVMYVYAKSTSAVLPTSLQSTVHHSTATAFAALEKSIGVLKEGVTAPDLSARAYISVYVGSRGEEEVLAIKNADEELPLASITKLMTALVATEHRVSDSLVVFSKKTLEGKGTSGVYHVGDELYFDDALHALLIASHNEVATALANRLGVSAFVELMNQRAQSIGLSHTRYANVTGLDVAAGNGTSNYSTVADVYHLARLLFAEHPEFFAISAQKEFILKESSGTYIATIVNTDKLVGDPSLPYTIIGSKTGETPQAKQNLLIITEAPCKGLLYNVVLHSDHRFEDMRSLLMYDHDSYLWNCAP